MSKGAKKHKVVTEYCSEPESSVFTSV